MVEREYATPEEVSTTLWYHDFKSGSDWLLPENGITGQHRALAAQLHVPNYLHGSYYLCYMPSQFLPGARFTVGSAGDYTVYWMMDNERKIRNCMMYKHEGAYCTKQFLRYRTKDTGYSTCLFGLHQLYSHKCFEAVPDTFPVVLTDSPSVAIVQSRNRPDALFLSTCGMYPTAPLLEPLYKREVVVLFEDVKQMKRAAVLLRQNKCSTTEIQIEPYQLCQ